MNREELLEQVKQAVREIEPSAEIILYGSRSRKDSDAQSDWDFLILLDGPVDDACIDKIRHRLYEIEWACDEVLCSIIISREEWNSPLYKSMPFHQNVEIEGVVI
ncbi:MAG: nucleotidyltransferase domain-containing protein [Sedimentisphaerales bacterium]|nr:nucleotidyltransferase domain-containing protein [Sedimentisphaerales bacterium]